MQSSLYIWSVIVYLSIIFSTGIISRSSSTQKSVLQPYTSCRAIIRLTKGRVDAVRINVTKLIVQCIRHRFITLFRRFIRFKITRFHNPFICSIWYHRMCPPIWNCTNVVVVIVCYSISHLHIFSTSDINAFIEFRPAFAFYSVYGA